MPLDVDNLGMRRPGSPWWYRLRWVVLAAWTAICFGLCVRPGRAGVDWSTVDRGAHLLTGGQAAGGLHLYARDPSIQIGPLTLGAVRFIELFAGRHAALAVALIGTALLLPALAGLERAVRFTTDAARHRAAKLTLIGGLFIVPAWLQATVVYAHPDDVLVAVFTVGALVAVARRRPLLGLMIALAIAAKPTAVVLVPLVFVFSGRSRATAGSLAALGFGAWLPFVIADRATLLASHPQTLVQPHSGLSLFGLAGTPAPTVLRLAQFGLPLVIGWLVVRRGQWAAVPLIGYGLRVAIDPGDFAYYAVGVLVAALAWHLLRDNPEPSARWSSSVPWTVIAASIALSAPAGLGRFIHPHVPSTAQIVLRLFVPLLVVGYAVWLDGRSQHDIAADAGSPQIEVVEFLVERSSRLIANGLATRYLLGRPTSTRRYLARRSSLAQNDGRDDSAEQPEQMGLPADVRVARQHSLEDRPVRHRDDHADNHVEQMTLDDSAHHDVAEVPEDHAARACTDSSRR